jgi:hypothetical protein
MSEDFSMFFFLPIRMPPRPLLCALAFVGVLSTGVSNLLAQPRSRAGTAVDTVNSDTTITFIPLSSDSGKLLGQLQKLIQAHIANASAHGRTLFVEMGATWCRPCRRLEARIRKNDPAIVDAFTGAYVLHMDVDDWRWEQDSTEFGSLGFDGGVMPILYAMDTTGKVVDELTQGDNAWLIKQFVDKHQWRK